MIRFNMPSGFDTVNVIIRVRDPNGLYKFLGAMIAQGWDMTKNLVSVAAALPGAVVSKVSFDFVSNLHQEIHA